MAEDSQERKTFNKFKTMMIKHLGSKALDNTKIDKVGRKLFASWGGCFASDRVKFQPYHYYIINVDTHDQPGSHWLACFTQGKKCYVWDSYGRSIKKLAPHLIKSIYKSKMILGKTNLIPQMEQIGWTSEICGAVSIAWLLVVQKLGITKAKNI